VKHRLLEPFRLHDLELPNRVVMAPLTRSRSGPDRIPNAAMAEYYAQRSSAGLIVSEATTISPQANGWLESPGIYSNAMEAGWRMITDTVHARGGRIFLQLWHMGRASHSDFHDGRPPVSASAVRRGREVACAGDGVDDHAVAVGAGFDGGCRLGVGVAGVLQYERRFFDDGGEIRLPRGERAGEQEQAVVVGQRSREEIGGGIINAANDVFPRGGDGRRGGEEKGEESACSTAHESPAG